MARFDNPFALLGDEDDGAGVSALVERIVADKAAAVRKELAHKKKAAAAERKAMAHDQEVAAAAERKEVAHQKVAAVAEEQMPVTFFGNGRGRGRSGHGPGMFGGGRGRGYNNGRQANFENRKQYYGYDENQHQDYGYNENQHQDGGVLENGTEVQGRGYSNAYNVTRYENGDNNGGRGYGRFRGDFREGQHRQFDGNDGGRNVANDNDADNGDNNGGQKSYGRFRGDFRDGQRSRFGGNDGGRNVRNIDGGRNDNVADNGDGSLAREANEIAATPEAVEAKKELSVHEKKQLEEEQRKREERERRKKEWEEEAKKITLRQYEEDREERRKVLEETLKKLAEEKKTPEGLKIEERMFAIEDKKIDKVIHKRNEGLPAKQKFEKAKLRRKNSLEKEEKNYKAIIPNFQYRRPERNNSSANLRDGPQDNRTGNDYTGGLSVRAPEPEKQPAPFPAPELKIKIGDHQHFPLLSGGAIPVSARVKA